MRRARRISSQALLCFVCIGRPFFYPANPWKGAATPQTKVESRPGRIPGYSKPEGRRVGLGPSARPGWTGMPYQGEEDDANDVEKAGRDPSGRPLNRYQRGRCRDDLDWTEDHVHEIARP